MKFVTKFSFDEYVGKQIYYLTPIEEVDELAKDGSRQWLFRCVCGKTVISTPYRVITGHIKSCGCMRYKNRSYKCKTKSDSPRVDIDEFIGKKNNRLTVVGATRPSESGRWLLECKCDCGNIVHVLPYQFKNGAVKSCGCIRGEKRKTHGLSKTPLYGEWFQMVNRCHNPKAHNYDRYGGRGITVCDEWRESPVAFAKWVEETGGKPDGTTLDRIDNDGPYAPWNCRWATQETQSRNKRSTRLITYNGKTQCLSDWSKELSIARYVLEDRLNRGWSVEKAFSTPVQSKKDKAAP